MKLIVMSDSHGNDQYVERIIKDNKDADYFIHLGDLCSDYPFDLILVKGNNDYQDLPYELFSSFNGLRIMMTHSHRYGYINNLYKMADKAKQNDCQIVLYGHTHMYKDEYIDSVRMINPGSLLYNRDYSPIGYLVININNENDYQVIRKVL